MNETLLIKIYEQILKESMTLGGGAIGGFTAPAAPYIITKKRKKKRNATRQIESPTLQK